MKKQKWFGPAAALLALLTVIAAVWCYDRKNRSEPLAAATDFIMDTFVEQRLYGKNAQQAVEEIRNLLKEFEKKLSMHLMGSELDRINKNAGKDYVPVSELTFEAISKAREYSSLSKGAFDLTVGPLVSEWGITSPNPQIPAFGTIEQLLPLVNWEDVLLREEDCSVLLKNAGMKIDLGGVAKGMACQIVFDTAEKYGIRSGYVSIGGNLAVIGQKPDCSEFLFGLRDPRSDASQYLGTLYLPGRTMATTGDYERYFEQDGVRYHHVLDPRTGYPAKNGLISVTVIGEDGGMCDFLSTALFVAGKEEAIKLLTDDRFDLILVDEEKNVYLSKGLTDVFQVNEAKTDYTFHFVQK